MCRDHIGFMLPDRGSLFVAGKSGSGKTTLLALLILAVSFLVPMLRLRRIGPTNVIKAKV